MAAQVQYRVDGLREVQDALRKAGASVEDLKSVNADAARLIQREAIKRAPHRSGRLRQAIIVSSTRTEGKVVGLGAVPYMGVVHFGWVTRNAARGLSRKEAQAKLSGALTRRSINKSVAGQKARVTRRKGEVVKTRGRVRGGPIKPNPFMYLARSDQEAAVYQQYDEKATAIVKAFNNNN